MSVEVIFTKGFGNNLFQYVFGRLLAEHHKIPLYHTQIYNQPQSNPKYRNGIVDIKTQWNMSNEESNKSYRELFNKSAHYRLKDYFEDYTLYIPHEEKIKSWFPKITITNYKDLVVHFRAGDALLYKNNLINFPSSEEWNKVISSIPHQNLYVVTDCVYRYSVNEQQIKTWVDDICKKRGYTNRQKFLGDQEAMGIVNSYIDLFNEHNCIWIHSDDYMNDFNFLRKFNKVVAGPSTFSWWALFLSDAKEKYIYRSWRKGKGIRNKNLGQVPEWNGWG